MFKKILVPLDGSMLAEKALPYAVRLANRLDAQLYLIRVVEAPRLVGNQHKLAKGLVNSAESYLANLTHLLSSRTLKPHTEALRLHTAVIRGEAVAEICSFARNLEIDLVVMSTHGRSGLPRLLAGSVATKILHQLNTPVMLVRPFEQKHGQLLAETFSGVGEPYSNRFEGNGGRLVLTLDGTRFAETALGPACELAASLQAELHLLNVRGDETQFYYGDLAGMGYMETRYYEVSPDDDLAPATYLGDIRRQVSEKGLRSVIGIRKGEIAEQIVSYACQNSADAIVMATHAPSELGWFLSGSTAAAVMRQSHLPVLMIPVHSEADANPAGSGVEMRELTRSH
jgi:nucleotide-binding universal stress UspA family protein